MSKWGFLSQEGVRWGLDRGESRGGALGQEQPWRQAGGLAARPCRRVLVVLSNGKLEGLGRGRARMLVCDLVVPPSGCGTLAASTPPREVLRISRRHS